MYQIIERTKYYVLFPNIMNKSVYQLKDHIQEKHLKLIIYTIVYRHGTQHILIYSMGVLFFVYMYSKNRISIR